MTYDIIMGRRVMGNRKMLNSESDVKAFPESKTPPRRTYVANVARVTYHYKYSLAISLL